MLRLLSCQRSGTVGTDMLVTAQGSYKRVYGVRVPSMTMYGYIYYRK